MGGGAWLQLTGATTGTPFFIILIFLKILVDGYLGRVAPLLVEVWIRRGLFQVNVLNEMSYLLTVYIFKNQDKKLNGKNK